VYLDIRPFLFNDLQYHISWNICEQKNHVGGSQTVIWFVQIRKFFEFSENSKIINCSDNQACRDKFWTELVGKKATNFTQILYNNIWQCQQTEVWQNLLTYYANRLMQSLQLYSVSAAIILPARANFAWFLFDGITYQILSTDPKLNTDTDCYGSDMKIRSNLLSIC